MDYSQCFLKHKSILKPLWHPAHLEGSTSIMVDKINISFWILFLATLTEEGRTFGFIFHLYRENAFYWLIGEWNIVFYSYKYISFENVKENTIMWMEVFRFIIPFVCIGASVKLLQLLHPLLCKVFSLLTRHIMFTLD